MIRKRILPALLVSMGLLFVVGCKNDSKSNGNKAAPGAEPAAIKVITTFQFGSSEQADNITDLCYDYGTVFVGTKKCLQAVNFDSASGKVVLNADLKVETASGAGFEVTRLRKESKQLIVCTTDGFTTFDGKQWASESMGPVNDAVTYADVPWIARNTGIERKGSSAGGSHDAKEQRAPAGDLPPVMEVATPEHDWKDQKVPSIKMNPALSNRVHGLAVTPDNRLWIGSEFGIYSYFEKDRFWGTHLYGEHQDMMGGMISNAPGNSNLCGNTVNRVDVDANTGRLLICTSTGLSIFDGKENWTSVQGDYEVLSSDDGTKRRVTRKGNANIPSSNINQALFLGNVVWLATPAGLVRKEGDRIDVYDTEQGFPSSYVTSMTHDPDKKLLYVGTEKGLAVLSHVEAGAASTADAK